MIDGQRYAFTERLDRFGRSVILPYLPLTLTSERNSVEVTALLDTGATVSVLPYHIGIQLGAVWEDQTVSIPLSGNLAQSESRGLILTGTIAQFPPVLLAFAWTRSNDIPVILGHTNFLRSSMCVFIGTILSLRFAEENYESYILIVDRDRLNEPSKFQQLISNLFSKKSL